MSFSTRTDRAETVETVETAETAETAQTAQTVETAEKTPDTDSELFHDAPIMFPQCRHNVTTTAPKFVLLCKIKFLIFSN